MGLHIKNPAWILCRRRRTVPQPEDLYPVVQNIFADRGTNSLEGGVHQNTIRKLGSFGTRPHMTDCHYDPWMTQTISNLEESFPLDNNTRKKYQASASLFPYSQECFETTKI
ncbi:hypothetical protein INT45_014292 [Circinella minor]|uniref:Uncharacterized protein n=1 Tax=Circinella minor TaxID=1195481 RepID=A0A8H7RQS5_9FUNG|nr:hypothetical protein INT45_014292 [Circinella minor]